MLIVAAGDAKIENSKYKGFFHTKAKMLTQEQAREMTGHAVGGVPPSPIRRGADLSGRVPEALRHRVPRGGQLQLRHRAHL